MNAFLRQQPVKERILSKFAPLNPRPGYSLGSEQRSWAISQSHRSFSATIVSTISLDMTKLPPGSISVRDLPRGPHVHASSFSRDYTESQQPKEREDAMSALNKAIETLNLARDASTIAPAKAVFGSVSVILSTIRVGFLLVSCRPIVD